MRRSLLVLLALGLAAGLPGPACGAAAAQEGPREVTVFAAASLADALDEVGKAFSAASGVAVVCNFAGSNDLARQLAAGAPADVFLAADRNQIERVAQAGRLTLDAAVPLLGNTLVVIVPAGEKARPLAKPADLLAFERLALADPEAVPAGVYAKEWLSRAGLWSPLAGRVVPTLDVRAALAAVASGSLPAGIVYATDAASTTKVRVVYRVPAGDAPPIRYWLAALDQPSGATRRFLAFLTSEPAGAVLRRHGFDFTPPPLP